MSLREEAMGCLESSDSRSDPNPKPWCWYLAGWALGSWGVGGECRPGIRSSRGRCWIRFSCELETHSVLKPNCTGRMISELSGGTWEVRVEAAWMGNAGWAWFTGTRGPHQISGQLRFSPHPWAKAGHRWEGEDQKPGKGLVLGRPRFLAACILGAENSDKVVVGAPCLFWDEADDIWCWKKLSKWGFLGKLLNPESLQNWWLQSPSENQNDTADFWRTLLTATVFFGPSICWPKSNVQPRATPNASLLGGSPNPNPQVEL